MTESADESDPLGAQIAQEIFDALPEPQREAWIAMGHFLVERYAPKGPANPFVRAPRRPRST